MVLLKESVIHIGYPKCASTFLQQVIFPQVTSYQYIADAHTHTLMSTRYYDNLPDDFLLFRLERNNYIYSNEGILNFCVHWSGGKIKSFEREIAISNLIRIFRDYGRILIVIRRQDEIIESLLRHKAMEFLGDVNKIFLDFPIEKKGNNYQLLTKRGRYLTEMFDYNKWIMRIANQLGKERVYILVYEDLVHNPRIFFDNLCRVLDTEDIEDLYQSKDNKRNVSQRRNIILPGVIKPSSELKNVIPPGMFTRIRKVFEREIYLSKTIKTRLMDLYKNSNQSLSDEFGLELDKYGYF